MGALENLKSTTDELSTYARQTRDNQGPLADLNTSATSTFVAAINSLKATVDALAAAAGAQIDDSIQAADKTWSSDKIVIELAGATQAAVDAITGGTLDAAKDQLVELVAFIETNETGIASILQTQGNRVAYDVVQNKNAAEKARARTNIGAASSAGVGDETIDFHASALAILNA